jgi:ketosteroid isomerase-like protein
MKTLVLITMMFAFGATGLVNAQCSDADKKALKAFDIAWGVAGENGDRAALANIYADDYVGLPGMQSKASAIEASVAAAALRRANPADADKVTPDHYAINCTTSSATVTHRNVAWVPSGQGGKPETFYSRSIHVMEKRGGKWQVVSSTSHDLNDADIIWYMEQEWNDAVMNRDKAWFDKNFAPDFTSISSSSARLSNKTEDIADTIGDRSTNELVETTNVNIRVDGNAAIATGLFRLKGKDEKGAAFDRRIRYTDVFIKRDGRWQAWSSQGTEMR